MLRQISLALVGLVIGTILTIGGFWAYFAGNPTLNLAGFFYGVPLLLGGLALKASELTPVPFSEPTTPEVLALREQQATPTQNQLRKDVTRYRYGQEAHLDEALKRLGLSPTDEERPVLKELQEMVIDGAYTLVLKFYSPLFPLETWQEKQDKIATFFGPGLKAEVSQPGENQINLALIVAKV